MAMRDGGKTVHSGAAGRVVVECVCGSTEWVAVGTVERIKGSEFLSTGRRVACAQCLSVRSLALDVDIIHGSGARTVPAA